MPMPKLTPPQIEERFWARVVKDTECWIWTGLIDHNGHGAFRKMGAHRFSYRLAFGKIPPNKIIHHKCKTKRCVNPDHLQAVDPKEHPDDIAVINKQKTHCPHGHFYDESNTLFNDGRRVCRTCHKQAMQDDYKKYHAKRLAEMKRYRKRKAAERKATSKC